MAKQNGNQRMQQEQIKDINSACAYIETYVLAFGRKPLAIGVTPLAYSFILREAEELTARTLGADEAAPDFIIVKGVVVVRNPRTQETHEGGNG